MTHGIIPERAAKSPSPTPTAMAPDASTSPVEWGPEIRVDGKRPGWIRNDDWRSVRTLALGEWQTADVESPGDSIEDMSEWAWDTITAIRLPADHPHYRQLTTPELDPVLWDRMEALVRRIASHDTPFAVECRAIVADLPKPADPDEEIARDLVRAAYPEMKPGYAGRRYQIALAAIKRGRELAGEQA